MSGGALRGLRIVEFEGLGPAPFATMLLADMGADVVRIARPGVREVQVGDGVTGRNRRVLELDLKAPDALETARGLIARADVLVEGFRPGVMERIGLGPELALELNPRLVYGRMTGWGQEGPLAARAGHDINYIALTGALAAIGPAEAPVAPLNLVGDYGGGSLYLVMGILAALVERAGSGRGQVVDAAMCDGALSLMSVFHDMHGAGLWRDRRGANIIDGGAPYYGPYQCADGGWLAVGPVEAKFWGELLERAGLASDRDFDRRDDPAAWPALRAKLAAVFLTRTRDEWMRLYEDSDACVSPVLQLGEVAEHPHMRARGAFVEVDGRRQPAPAPRFSRSASPPPRPPEQVAATDLLEEWTAAG